jgi:sporulation protein YlmC with PRC-barrel domain
VLILASVEEIFGKDVIDTKGYNLGEVKGAEADLVRWNITHLHVKLSSKAADELGFKKRFRSSTICLPVSYVSSVGDVVTLNHAVDELANDVLITECKKITMA